MSIIIIANKNNNYQSLPLAQFKWKHIGKRATDIDRREMSATKKDKNEIKNKLGNNYNQ